MRGSLRGGSADEVTTYWTKLSDGVTVLQPLAPAQWAPLYGTRTESTDILAAVDSL